MIVYLHIGTEKTGSTTIQEFLRLNRPHLDRAGYQLTSSSGQIQAREVAVAAYNIDRRDEFTAENELFSHQDLAHYQQAVIQRLQTDFARERPEKLILSSEHFQSRLTHKEEIKRLREILSSLGATKFHVIVYLRKPSEIAQSLFSTAVIGGEIRPHPPGPEDAYYGHICNHQNTLENFAAVFGEWALRPRIFEIGALRNASLLEDFAEAIDLPWLDSFTLPEVKNESLSWLGLEILRRINNNGSEAFKQP